MHDYLHSFSLLLEGGGEGDILVRTIFEISFTYKKEVVIFAQKEEEQGRDF